MGLSEPTYRQVLSLWPLWRSWRTTCDQTQKLGGGRGMNSMASFLASFFRAYNHYLFLEGSGSISSSSGASHFFLPYLSTVLFSFTPRRTWFVLDLSLGVGEHGQCWFYPLHDFLLHLSYFTNKNNSFRIRRWFPHISKWWDIGYLRYLRFFGGYDIFLLQRKT